MSGKHSPKCFIHISDFWLFTKMLCIYNYANYGVTTVWQSQNITCRSWFLIMAIYDIKSTLSVMV